MFTHGLDSELSVGLLPTLLFPHFTHHSASISTFFDSAFYFPHSAIPHFTNDRPVQLQYVQLIMDKRFPFIAAGSMTVDAIWHIVL